MKSTIPSNLNLGLGLGKCPKSGHQTVKEVNEREVIGLTQCKTIGLIHTVKNYGNQTTTENP